MDVLLALKSEMYPKDSPLRSIDDQADVTLDPKAIRKMASVSDAWDKLYPDNDDMALDKTQRSLLAPRRLGAVETDFGSPIGTGENVGPRWSRDGRSWRHASYYEAVGENGGN